MATFPQANAPRYLFKVGGKELMVVAFRLEERISTPFWAVLQLASEDELKFEDTVGKIGVLTIESGQEDRHLNGIVSRFARNGINGRFFLYEAQVVPQLQLLGLDQDCRIFQQKSVPDIVREVLEESGITGDLFDFRLQGNYAPRDYCVQYRESDLNFISRLLEDEGIFFFFEHSTEKHLLVFGDGTVNYQPIAGEAKVIFNPGGGMVAEEEAVFGFNVARQLRTGKYSLRDFNFQKPDLDLTADHTDQENKKREVYDYPGVYETTEDGKHLAQVRLEQSILFKERAEGSSVVPRFVPGFCFTLEGHDLDSFNAEYLLTGVVHQGAQSQVLAEKAGSGEGTSYENMFTAIASSVTLRPERQTPKPVVEGVQTAIVTGPSGEEIYTDKHGRIKVQFHWDRNGNNDDKSSCWIRVSQAWAGAGWGAMFIPRIGQEVIVDFVEGNPDRPLVTGRVYHGTNTPPYTLPDEKTKSTIKSDTTTGGGGSNEIRFEDKKGSEEIYIHGQKDWTITIENDKNQSIGHDESLSVGNDRTKSVQKSQDETIGENKTISVGKNHSESVGENMSVTVGKNLDETTGESKSVSVGKNLSESVGESASHSIGKNRSVSVADNHSLDVGKDLTENIGKKMTLTVGDDGMLNIGKNLGIDVREKTLVSTGKELTLKCGSASIVLKKDGTIQIKGKDINIKGSGDVSIKGSNVKEN